ncbi:AAA family ATPase [beta proteobacterium AAP99]|nr:AAA family ATPase [beta proteobacterium AAP99]
MSIAVANVKSVYDPSKIERALNELTASANDALKSTYEKMIRMGGERFCVKPSEIPQIDALEEALPNFAEPLADLRKQVALCASSGDPLEITPMLLLGEPGIGKTHFARKISDLLGTSHAFMSMSSMTAGWVISGASSQWKNAKPGKVFETLVNGEYANPLMLIDEVDKAAAQTQYDPLGALYSLLEHDTACSFIDEFAEVPIDCSQVIWIATANDARAIPGPILNRMNVYEIESPDADGLRRIAETLYNELRASHAWGEEFEPEINELALSRLSELKPRDMRRMLLNAFGSAKLAGRDHLVPEDFAAHNVKKAKVGFL